MMAVGSARAPDRSSMAPRSGMRQWNAWQRCRPLRCWASSIDSAVSAGPWLGRLSCAPDPQRFMPLLCARDLSFMQTGTASETPSSSSTPSSSETASSTGTAVSVRCPLASSDAHAAAAAAADGGTCRRCTQALVSTAQQRAFKLTASGPLRTVWVNHRPTLSRFPPRDPPLTAERDPLQQRHIRAQPQHQRRTLLQRQQHPCEHPVPHPQQERCGLHERWRTRRNWCLSQRRHVPAAGGRLEPVLRQLVRPGRRRRDQQHQGCLLRL